MSTSEYELLNIETFVLKVHMNCQGCINRVRKLLRKIEGVYKVHIDAEEQKVIVTGSVEPSTLVKKLVKSGKHAEIWNASSFQEQGNNVKDNRNKNQTQYLTNDPNTSENQYTIPRFYGREDHRWGPEWYLNQDLGMENVDNRTNHINGNHKWEESMVPTMSHGGFQENSGTNSSGLGSQEWEWHLSGVSPISDYSHPPSLTGDMHGYFHNYQPSKMMQLYYYNHLPRGVNVHMQEGQIANDLMMKGHN